MEAIRPDYALAYSKKIATGGGALLCAITLWASPGFAQTAPATAATSSDDELQEVIITGTSIRGEAPTGSELTTVSREDIEATAATTSTELLRTVPEMNNFNATGGNSGANQAGFLDQPAIHGIGVGNGGAGLTLVLIDGHRLPGAGVNQTAPDAAVIPTSALERVEALADGGSSVYGSDAVAGVLNFITRKNFDGAETTVKDGFADGYKTYNFSQLLGKSWGSGSILFDYEYAGNSALNGTDRSYTLLNETANGGPDNRSTTCSPANITAGGVTYGLTPTGPVAGLVNKCEANRANDLYPQQYRNQVFTSLNQDLGDRADLYANVLFSGRSLYDHVAGSGLATGGLSVTVPSTSPFYIPVPGAPGAAESVTYNPSSDFGPTFTDPTTTNTLSVVGGSHFKVGPSWNGNLELNYGEERDDTREIGVDQAAATTAAANGTFNPYGVGAATSAAVLSTIGNYETRYYVKQTLKEGQLKFDGPLFNMTGGAAKAAIGVDFRKEEFDGTTSTGPVGLDGYPQLGATSTGPYVADASRSNDSAFAEIHLPVIGADNAMAAARKLDIALSARYDHYSDVGGTTNPKLGIGWTVVDGFAVRASAGRSFHAPSLADSPTAIDTRAIQFPCAPPFIGCAGAAPGAYGVILAGGNKLKPETANTYNLGFDWTPLQGMTVNMTYFRVQYDDVITFPTFAPVTNPLSAYDKYRTVRPAGMSDAAWAAIVTGLLAGFRDQGLIYPNNILPVAVYDLRRQNFANELINGVDYNVNYRWDTDLGRFTAGVSGTQLQSFYQKIPGVTQLVQLRGTDYAISTRARASLGWTQGEYNALLFVNYTGKYQNQGVTPFQDIGSFVTADLHLGWSPKLEGLLKDTQFTFDVSNLLDRDPPIFYSTGAIAGFDPTAANAFGRILAVGLHKVW